MFERLHTVIFDAGHTRPCKVISLCVTYMDEH